MAAGKHKYEFALDDAFFSLFSNNLLKEARVAVRLQLVKTEAMITVELHLDGSSLLVCDRSLEPFHEPIGITEKVFYKFGDHFGEADDNYYIIPRESETLDLGQIIYDLVALSVPIKKVHPSLRASTEEANEQDDLTLMYSSRTFDDTAEDYIADPRWEALKKLRNK